ncbi:MAG: DUF6580 family putative transport protein [Candidatus Saccharimonadales bacterium]
MKPAKLKQLLTSEVAMQISLAMVLIGFAVVSRLLPHPANVAPIAAVAIFGGAILPKKWAVFLPLTAMMVSDLFIGLHPLILFTWGSFAVIALASSHWLRRISPFSVVAASLGASVFFFLVSNFGVWLEGRLYPPTLEGLVHCYYNALPFFRNTLIGDLFYCGLLFGAYAFVRKVALREYNPQRLT